MDKAYTGFCLLGGVVFLWVTSSTAIQAIFTTARYHKPYFLTYFSTSLFGVYLLPLLFRPRPDPPSLSATFSTALFFSPLWFCANYLFNLSLGLTSVASTTILSSTSAVSTLVLSVILLGESPDVVKFIAAGGSLAGVGLVALSDTQTGSDSLSGDLCALTGAATYAVYSVMLKLKATDIDTTLLFGFLGAINSILFFPGLVAMDLLMWEELEWPGTQTWIALCGNAALGTVVADLMWAMSLKKLSPAVCTMGLSLTIPLSMFEDVLVQSATFPLQYMAGTALILLSFLLMSLFEFPGLSVLLSNRSLTRLFLLQSSSSESLELKSS